MDRNLAMIILSASFRSAGELANLAPLVKEFCRDEEYEQLKSAIDSLVWSINTELTERMYSLYPDLRDQVAERIETYGRAF